MTLCSRLILTISVLFVYVSSWAQVSSAHVVYERKTNLLKKYKNTYMYNWVEASKKKSVIDTFHLYFNDSLSYFGPSESELQYEDMSWMTPKNKTYQNFNNQTVYSIKDVWGEESHTIDSTRKRVWKIVPGKRKVCGYDCQKAIWKANDSLLIYAWFCNELTVSTGPETFTGLPGVILGLATEDGGVVYFAKEVLLERIDSNTLQPKKFKGKVYKASELQVKLTKDLSKRDWGKVLLDELFGIW